MFWHVFLLIWVVDFPPIRLSKKLRILGGQGGEKACFCMFPLGGSDFKRKHESQGMTRDQKESRPREARPEDSSIYIYIYMAMFWLTFSNFQ